VADQLQENKFGKGVRFGGHRSRLGRFGKGKLLNVENEAVLEKRQMPWLEEVMEDEEEELEKRQMPWLEELMEDEEEELEKRQLPWLEDIMEDEEDELEDLEKRQMPWLEEIIEDVEDDLEKRQMPSAVDAAEDADAETEVEAVDRATEITQDAAKFGKGRGRSRKGKFGKGRGKFGKGRKGKFGKGKFGKGKLGAVQDEDDMYAEEDAIVLEKRDIPSAVEGEVAVEAVERTTDGMLDTEKFGKGRGKFGKGKFGKGRGKFGKGKFGKGKFGKGKLGVVMEDDEEAEWEE